jgi:hypothetical protein
VGTPPCHWSFNYGFTCIKAVKDDVAEQLITLCASESITGQTILMDCGRLYITANGRTGHYPTPLPD